MNTTVLVSTFLAASIEVIEMVAIVIAVGATRQWRGALAGTLGGLVVLAVLIGGLGTALQQVPLSPIRVVVGALLTTFGTFWANEGLGTDWPGGDLALVWLGAFYVAAALVLVRVVSYWRQGTPRRLRAAAPLTEWRSR